MRIIALSTIKKFWQQSNYSDAEQPLRAWYDEAKHATWETPQDIKNKYRSASFIAGNRVVFNIHGNKYRLILAVKYEFGLGYVRFIGTHKQYDEVDVEKI